MSRRIVAVAGASRGIGRALAERYAHDGWDVWAGCRRPEETTGLGALGVRPHPLDVCDETSVREFAEAVGQRVGLDLLINAAGVDARAFGADEDARGPWELSAEHFLAEVHVNAVGPMLTTRAFRHQLAAAPGSKVVNLSSRTGSMDRGGKLCFDIGYNASKAALNMVTVRTARLLAEQGVTVVAVHPGWVRTDMGGEDAPTGTDVAARRLVTLIETIRPDQSGAFLSPNGTVHPW